MKLPPPAVTIYFPTGTPFDRVFLWGRRRGVQRSDSRILYKISDGRKQFALACHTIPLFGKDRFGRIRNMMDEIVVPMEPQATFEQRAIVRRLKAELAKAKSKLAKMEGK